MECASTFYSAPERKHDPGFQVLSWVGLRDKVQLIVSQCFVPVPVCWLELHNQMFHDNILLFKKKGIP